MTRDERICTIYRAGDLTIQEIAAEVGLAKDTVSRILRRYGVNSRESGRERASVVPREMRATYVGDTNMTSAQLADAVRRRLEQPNISKVYLIMEKGRVYAPSRNSATLDAFVLTYPKLFVGCYARGVKASAIAEDLESVRGGAA